MATLGTQNISTSYPQLLKTLGLGGVDGTLQAITDGDNTSSALELSTVGVRSTGTLNAVGATTLASSLAVTGAVTLSSSLAVTGAVTLSSSLAVTGAATFGTTVSIGTTSIPANTNLFVYDSDTLAGIRVQSGGADGFANVSIQNDARLWQIQVQGSSPGDPLLIYDSTAGRNAALISGVDGSFTFGTGFTSSSGTNTIGTATISTSTISSATIPRINGVTTFATGFTSSTGTNTIGTIESTTINNTGIATVGSLEIGGSAGPIITKVSYGTAAFTLSTVSAFNAAGTTNGTFTLTGCALGDMMIGSLDSLGTATGSAGLIIGFHPIATNVARYSITNPTTTAGTVPAGTIQATAIRFTA